MCAAQAPGDSDGGEERSAASVLQRRLLQPGCVTTDSRAEAAKTRPLSSSPIPMAREEIAGGCELRAPQRNLSERLFVT